MVRRLPLPLPGGGFVWRKGWWAPFAENLENLIGRAQKHVICSPVYVYYVSLRDVLHGLTPALKGFLEKFAHISLESRLL